MCVFVLVFPMQYFMMFRKLSACMRVCALFWTTKSILILIIVIHTSGDVSQMEVISTGGFLTSIVL
jgi:hypothetical protein